MIELVSTVDKMHGRSLLVDFSVKDEIVAV